MAKDLSGAWSRLQTQSRTRHILRGEFQADMRSADFLEALMHDALRQFRLVALAAQVTEIKMAQFGGHNVLRGIGGRFVGKMAVPSEDSLLKAPRSARAVLQHFHVVIGFQHERVGVAHAFADEPREVAEVGGKSNARRRRAQQKPDRILGVVRNGKRFDENVADFKTRPGGENAAVQFRFELILGGVVRRAVAVNGNAEFFAKRGQTLDVVAVFVRDEDAGEIFRRAANGGEALADLAETETRIHENARLGGFHVGAIAVGTAAQNRQVNSHS